MAFLVFLKEEWKPLCMLVSIFVVFACGYHLRALQDAVKDDKAVISAEKKNEKAAIIFEDTQAKVLNTTHDLTTKMQEENAKNPNHCFISVASLRLIQQANR